MKITTATFDCTIAMPGYNNVKPGASEIILEPGETIEDAWTELNRRAQAWHRKEYPQFFKSQDIFEHFTDSKTPIHVTYENGTLPTIFKEDEKLEIAIDNCKDVSELYELKDKIITASPGIIAYYNSRVKLLNGERPTNFTDGL